MSQTALSTIAMTIYNYLQLRGGNATAAQMVAVEGVQDQHAIDADQATIALDQLVDRGLLAKGFPNGRTDAPPSYHSNDRQLRLVTKRDRSDADVMDDGTVTGGWNGWEVQDGPTRLPIQEAIR